MIGADVRVNSFSIGMPWIARFEIRIGLTKGVTGRVAKGRSVLLASASVVSACGRLSTGLPRFPNRLLKRGRKQGSEVY
jgi:hypothetical protein